MFIIKLGRNDKCLCGSNIKYKNCCQKNGIQFSQVSDLDFIVVEEFTKTVPEEIHTPTYTNTLELIYKLKSHCERYKVQVLGEDILKTDNVYLYIFKENKKSKELLLSNIKLLGKSNSVSKDKLSDNIGAALIMINKLRDCICE